MVRTCPHCGSSDIDEDAARGDATCMDCGTVLEESIVVSENQFQERAGGTGHSLVGQFVSMERAQTHTLQGVPGLSSQESREVTFQRGRKLIEEVASQLRINHHCIETAYNFFKMCVSRNLTRGRIRSHVVAACLYMTCRLENTAHLLLDFSDVTQVNVFDLGRTLSFLSRSLRINLPATDPCLYIMRFACLLDFGDKQKEVVNLATRLVQRMKRDWMSTGRRPTGLCGAALLIAARSFNFNRTISDVVRVVHISESVVRKRLDEFSQTPSGALTIDEFATVDLEHSEDPPAFREARRRAREEQLMKEAEAAETMEKDVQPMEEELEKALEKKRREKFKHTKYAKMVAGGLDDPEVGSAEAALVRDDIIDSVFDAADGRNSPSATNNFAEFRPTLQSLGISSNGTVCAGVAMSPSVESAVCSTSQTRAPLSYPILPAMDNLNGDLDLDDIDDEEIDSYILSNAEASMKERFWMKLNGEHVKEMERRKREREEQDEKDKDNPTKKKKRRVNNQARPIGQSATATEAMEKIIQEKKLSNKVNYDILKEIEHTAGPIPSVDQSAAAALKDAESRIAKIEAHIQGITESPSPSVSFVDGVATSLSNDDLSKKERETQRRNAHHSSVSRLTAVQTALKVDTMTPSRANMETTSVTTPASASSSVKSGKDCKPSLFSRSRFGRARPNLGAASMKRDVIPEPPTDSINQAEIAQSTIDSDLVITNASSSKTTIDNENGIPPLPPVMPADVSVPSAITDVKPSFNNDLPVEEETKVKVNTLSRVRKIGPKIALSKTKMKSNASTTSESIDDRKPSIVSTPQTSEQPCVSGKDSAPLHVVVDTKEQGDAKPLSRSRRMGPVLVKTAKPVENKISEKAPEETHTQVSPAKELPSPTPSESSRRRPKANIPVELLRRSSRR